MDPQHSLAALTGAEARARLATGPVLLLPLGSLEEQGPATPMGDYLLAERIAELIAAALPDALVLPVLPFGGADYFGSVPGGISLGQATLRAVLRDILDGLARHGLTRILVVNGHGGNAQAIHDETLALRHRTGTVVPTLPIWRVAGAQLPRIVGAEAAARSTGHGADPLGSVAAHLLPELVRPCASVAAKPATLLGLEVSGFGTATVAGAEIGLPVELDEIAPGGDPSLCSAATGEALTAHLVETSVALVGTLLANGW